MPSNNTMLGFGLCRATWGCRHVDFTLKGQNRACVRAVKQDAFVTEPVERRTPVTHGGIIGQVWRGSAGRQVSLVRLLPALEVIPLDDVLGRQAGVLLGRARMDDVLDAALVLLAMDGDLLSTSDGSDLASLVRFPAFTSTSLPFKNLTGTKFGEDRSVERSQSLRRR